MKQVAIVSAQPLLRRGRDRCPAHDLARVDCVRASRGFPHHPEDHRDVLHCSTKPRKNSPRRAFTAPEWRRIHAALAECPAWERALFRTFADTGLRLREVCSLSIGSVLWRGCIVAKVPVAPMQQKGHYGATRWIPMTPLWRRALREHLKERAGLTEPAAATSPKSPLFVRPLRRYPSTWVPMTRSYAAQRLRALLDRARVYRDRGRLSSHSWRKTYAQHVLAAAGGDLFIVQRALNHQSVVATEKYAVANPSDVVSAVRRADWTRRPRKEETHSP